MSPSKFLEKSLLIITVRSMAFKYPAAKRDTTVDDLHGIKVLDPYRWLEDPDAKETKNFVQQQNDVTYPYIQNYEHRAQLADSITKLWNFPKRSPPHKNGDKYYQFRNTGLQNQNVLYQMDNMYSEGEVFLDPNTLSEDGTIALTSTKFTKSGNIMAYGLSLAGSDWMEIRFRNTRNSVDFKEVLKKVKFSTMSWAHDGVGFFYCAYSEQKGIASNHYQKLYYHTLGTEQKEDIVVVEFDDPELRIGGHVSYCGKFLVVTATKSTKNNMLFFTRLDSKVRGALQLTKVVENLNNEYIYVTNNKNKFLFLTNNSADNYCLTFIDFEYPEEQNWSVLVNEKNKVLVNAVPIDENKLILCYMKDVKHMLVVHSLDDGSKLHELATDIGTIHAISGRREHNELFYSFVSFLTPSIIYRVSFIGKITQTVIYETKVGDFAASNYVSKQVFFNSTDGTKVPMFIVHKNGFMQDGTKPCILYGYGGFNISVMPSFSVTRIAFLNHFDGCFAIANIRGGGEYGDKWHNTGRFRNKQNCFDDFKSATIYLHNKKYTNPKMLTIMGASNGGLLVAACMNQAPHLYSSVICQVGVLDMLRFYKFTIGYAWTSEYGSPEEKDDFMYMYKYSPLHNIHAPSGEQQYPATLLLTADHDDRVVPFHTLKFLAELQYKLGNAPTQTNPLLARIETKAGHGAGKPTMKLIEEATDILSFIGKSSYLEFMK